MGQFYLFIALIVFLSQSSVLNAQVCNGYSELCGRSYAAVAYPGTHNSFSYSKVPIPAQNQYSSISDQLQAGIRSLMLDGHNPPEFSKNPDGVHLCHTSCELLDAGDSVQTLKIIADFLINHPEEVVTIIWENYDDLPPSKYKAAYEAAGLDVLSFVQPVGQQQWPTLGEMVKMNKRCVSFIDREADIVNVPWLHDEFSYMIDTPYNATDPTGWKCVVDRPEGGSAANIALININNFLNAKVGPIGLPKPVGAKLTNGILLQQHLTQCTKEFGRLPNFISVDFSTKGNLYEIVAIANGLTPKDNHGDALQLPIGANSKFT